MGEFIRKPPTPKNRADAAPSAPKPRFNHSNKPKEKTK
ncbi:hypothetical protein NMH_0365 [Neisseria meningitidis H44/76]|uniref:Uncharacterized protein n=3 Tax=Neisseria meningitidis TaxID=487 RepID=E6MUB9_NEIMH|nr:hypothetical protein NMA510612_1337 [Neisseria meningitidis]EFV64805.1 hypothetical protein NMH_0365 [Neisseria meningitidis H44/76]CBA03974.1 hypothetical protein predicted by Glimmer/Critica [Neisseria meningitidis alpha153]